MHIVLQFGNGFLLAFARVSSSNKILHVENLHLQVNIFYHFKVCHDRRNGFTIPTCATQEIQFENYLNDAHTQIGKIQLDSFICRRRMLQDIWKNKHLKIESELKGI